MKHIKHQAVTVVAAIACGFCLLGGSGGAFATTAQNTQKHTQSSTTTIAENNMSQSREDTATANLNEGNAFLASNKTKEGVVTLPDGLQYKVIKAGTGAQPVDGDTVTVNYAGTFIDGVEFDSSYKRGQPISFPVNGVIAGWTEALKLMKVGDVWNLYIPGNLAYGKYGMSPEIGPNKTLIFKVELLGVNK